MNTPIHSLHSAYVRLTGYQVALTFQREYEWAQWLTYGKKCGGWGEHELQMVVALIRKRIRQQRRYLASLKFANLIGQHDRFEEDLAEARAEARTPVRTEREKVLESTGRIECKQQEARSAAQIIAADKAFEEFRRMRENL